MVGNRQNPRLLVSMDSSVSGYRNVGGIAGTINLKYLFNSYTNNKVNAKICAGGIVGFLRNKGTSTANVPKIYACNVANAIISAENSAGGLIGGAEEDLINEPNIYYDNLITANVETTKDKDTASIIIGGGKGLGKTQEQNYFYKYSKINGKNLDETTLSTFAEKSVTLNELKSEQFYRNKLHWGSTYNYSTLKDNKYPILANFNLEQTGIDLPIGPIDTLSIEEIPSISAYSLSANKMNVDFDKIPKGANLTYKSENTEEKTIPIKDRTYTFLYNYKSPVTMTISNKVEKKEVKILPETVKNTVSMRNNNIAHLDGETLVINGEKKEGKFVNLVQNQALEENGNLYNLDKNEMQENEQPELQLIEKESKKKIEYKGNKIEQYATYSKVNSKDINAIYSIHNNRLSVTDGKLEKINTDKIIDNYNGREYETILGTDGKIHNLKENVAFPKDFKNENIKELIVDNKDENKYVMARYENGDIIVFNYMTGETKEKVQQNPKISFAQFIKEKIAQDKKIKQEEKITNSYKKSQNLKAKLKEKPLEHTEKTENYITIYDNNKKQHKVYKESELLNIQDKKEIKSETEKIESNEKLQKYYLKAEKTKNIDRYGYIYVFACIFGVIITLIILRYFIITKNTKN